MEFTEIFIWKDKIVLKTKEQFLDARHAQEALRRSHFQLYKFGRWNIKFNGFLIKLSIQNLQLVMSQIPQAAHLYLSPGAQFLYKKKEEMDKILRKVGKVKNYSMSELPQYEYKLPPLGEYQHRGVAYLVNNPKAPLFADCGCLSWDSLVRITTAKCSRKVTLEKAYNTFHGRPSKDKTRKRVGLLKRLIADMYIRSFDGEIIRLHKINDIIMSGIKDTTTLTLEDGKSIRTTIDHEIMTMRGWIELGNLTMDDLVMVDNLSKHQKTEKEVVSKKTPDIRRAVGSYHPFARKQLSHQGKSHSYLIEIHRLVYEAHVNGLEIEEFIRITREDPNICKTLVFVDIQTHCVHHKSKDHYDNSIDNLEILTIEEHGRLHNLGNEGYAKFKHGIPEFSKVHSIKHHGMEMTYDIRCDEPYRNFVANGIVVHNCGKTFMVVASADVLAKKGVIQNGKTLICAKLNTIESTWVEDTKKFSNLSIGVLWAPTHKKNRRELIFDTLNSDYDMFVINHDGVRLFEDQLATKCFERVVVDESTILKSFKGESNQIKSGAFGKALMNVSRNAKYRVIMSGTPASNGPADLWGQYHFLDESGIILDPNNADFMERYYDVVDLRKKVDRLEKDEFGNVKYDNKGVPLEKTLKLGDPHNYVPKAGAIEAISNLTMPLAYRLKLRDVLPSLPERTIMFRSIEMSEEQRKYYKAMDKTLKVEIDEARIVVNLAITSLMKLRQITGGFIIDMQEKAHAIPSNPKLDELDSLLNEEINHKEKVIIYCQYRWEIETIEERYKSHGVVTVYGGNSGEKNIKNINRFINDPSIRLNVMHPKSAAHGITLVVAHYMIFYSISHSAEDNYQAIRRIERPGQKHPMFFYYLLCRKTIDTDIYDIIDVKDLDQEKLLSHDYQLKLEEKLINKWRTQ